MKKPLLTIAILVLVFPFSALAAVQPFYYTGWLPFWEKQRGTEDIAIHLEKLHEISPFSYEVNPGGSLRDTLKINQGVWPDWLKAVSDLHIKILPTIAWFDGAGIQSLLSSSKLRRAHEDTIANLVQKQHFDGIDIDYEGKLDTTMPYFSLFIKGLALRLHPRKKILSCTIESRTPSSSLYTEIPKNIKYANDYVVLNQYCDEVRIMAYDQGMIDIRLDAAKGNGALYAPVADPDWVKKVLQEAARTISKKKIVLGIPTYGYEYEVSWANGVTTYRRLRSVSYFTAMDLAERENAALLRNAAGELSFVYTTSTFFEVSPLLRRDVSSTQPAGPFAPVTNSTSTVTRFVSFADATAIAQKIKLAKQFGLRGVAFFKLDGQADPMLWEKMK